MTDNHHNFSSSDDGNDGQGHEFKSWAPSLVFYGKKKKEECYGICKGKRTKWRHFSLVFYYIICQ